MTAESPFLNIARRYKNQFAIILQEGKTSRPLRTGDEFKATPRHTLVVATICDKLGSWMGLDEKTQQTLNITAVLHDADKKAEYRPDEFTSVEKEELQNKIVQSGADLKLMEVTKEHFVEENSGNVESLTFPQLILYYADMIVSWDKITPFEERIIESMSRRTNTPQEFFEKELAFGKQVEIKIFESLPHEIRSQISKPEDIPDFLRTIFSQ